MASNKKNVVFIVSHKATTTNTKWSPIKKMTSDLVEPNYRNKKSDGCIFFELLLLLLFVFFVKKKKIFKKKMILDFFSLLAKFNLSYPHQYQTYSTKFPSGLVKKYLFIKTILWCILIPFSEPLKHVLRGALHNIVL